MSHVELAGLVIVRGSVGTGKTSLCRTLVEEFRLQGHEAAYISLGWWFRAMIALALWLAREQQGNMREAELFQTASAFTGSELVQAAKDNELTILPDGMALLRDAELQQPSGSALHQLSMLI